MLQVAHPGGTAQPLLTWCSQESTPLPNTLTGLGYSTLRFLVLPLPPQRLLQFPFPAPPPFPQITPSQCALGIIFGPSLLYIGFNQSCNFNCHLQAELMPPKFLSPGIWLS